jgi:hypothetical protein
MRRAATIERRLDALISDLGSARAGPVAQADMNNTMRAAWELVGALRASLVSLEERATRVVPAEIAALIALWTQLYAFEPGSSQILGWAAWAVLIVAILVVATLVMPSRLARFWDSLVPPEVVLADLRPLRPEEEAAIAANLSASLHAQIDRLRHGLRLTVSLSACALVLAAVAYVIDKW